MCCLVIAAANGEPTSIIVWPVPQVVQSFWPRVLLFSYLCIVVCRLESWPAWRPSATRRVARFSLLLALSMVPVVVRRGVNCRAAVRLGCCYRLWNQYVV